MLIVSLSQTSKGCMIGTNTKSGRPQQDSKIIVGEGMNDILRPDKALSKAHSALQQLKISDIKNKKYIRFA